MEQTDIFLRDEEEALLNNDGITAFITSMPYPTLLVSHKRIVIAANQKLCDFLRLPYNTNEVKGKNTLQVLGQLSKQFKDPEGIAKRILEITAKQQPVYNDRIDTTDGRVIYRDYAPFIYKGKAVADMWIFYDATEQVKAANAVAEQKLFYEDILNKVPSDIAVISPDLKYLFVNPAAIRDEATREWIIGKDDFDFCRERNKDIALAERRRTILLKVLEDKKDVEWEERMVSRKGEIGYHLRKISPVLDASGNIKLLIGYGFNITERKKIEEQVAVSEKKFKDLFNYSQALICTHDMEGRLIDVNPAFCEQTGYLAEEAIGKSIAYFLPAGDKPQFEENYLTPVKNNQRIKGLFRVLHKNGSLVYLLYQNFRVEQPGEEPYIVSFSQDVTERIKMEKELKEAKKITEETAKIKEKFLANMSHEIRTPMNGIMGITALLQKTPLNPEQAEYLKIVQDSAQILLNIINDILDLEKINSGNINLEVIPFDIGAKLKDIISLFTPVARDKKLALLLDVKFKPGTVLAGDPTRFTQIMNNLISNAIKFTHDGEVFLNVTLDGQAGNELNLVFEVSDTGVGIPPEKLSQLFEAFTQVDSSTTRKYGGTGLGLAICQRLVNLMGGDISATSIYGEGSVFSFSIKTVKSKNPVRTPLVCDLAALAGSRILIVDDNNTNLFILKTQLEHWKLEPVTASSGPEALAVLNKDNSFKLLITDMEMPEMDGVGLANQVKVKYPQLPVVMLSSIGDETKSKFPGLFSSILVKPVKQHHLCMSIQKAFNQDNTATTEVAAKSVLSADFAKDYPLRILVAEDNPINQKLIERVLGKLGYQPDIASNGLFVLEKLDENYYDIILMDIQMPELDGLETTAQIRGRGGNQPYIVAMTANAMQEDREVCIQAGMDDYLSKPMRLEDLVTILQKVQVEG